jgi:UDP-glucose 4-epimerase
MANEGKVIVTGGAGYIGSHTIAELLEHTGREVVSIDNHINSSSVTFERLRKITGRSTRNHRIDLCDQEAVRKVLQEEAPVAGIIHFAALKSVPESMAQPHRYYRNNLVSLLNLLECSAEAGIRSFIFSSSCSVYGNITQLPVGEETPLGLAESPYAYTKQIGERMVDDHARVHAEGAFISLRYFNPVGAHRTGYIGEDPINPPTSLVPIITRVASGRIPSLTVHGTDYGTRDGSCVRDYIHVSDIARAHVKALEYAMQGHPGHSVFNLGTGQGVSVLEAIASFERATGNKLNYKLGPRRPGDVEAIYSDTTRSTKVLGWRAELGIDEMMRSAWQWEQELLKTEGGAA